MQNEESYIHLIKHILNNGTLEITRNGNTISTFGEMMKFSLSDNKVLL